MLLVWQIRFMSTSSCCVEHTEEQGEFSVIGVEVSVIGFEVSVIALEVSVIGLELSVIGFVALQRPQHRVCTPQKAFH